MLVRTWGSCHGVRTQLALRDPRHQGREEALGWAEPPGGFRPPQVRSSPQLPSPQGWPLVFCRQEEEKGCWSQVNLLEDPVPHRPGKKPSKVPVDSKGERA